MSLHFEPRESFGLGRFVVQKILFFVLIPIHCAKPLVVLSALPFTPTLTLPVMGEGIAELRKSYEN